jgi:hypothetical protein
VRNFLEKHSSLYRWAGREKADAADGWQETADTIRDILAERTVEHAQAVERLSANHSVEITAHDAANSRLRRINRDLVAKVRELGAPAAEYPAERCPGCGSMAAFPEDGRHITGLVRYVDRTVKLYCDGTEA